MSYPQNLWPWQIRTVGLEPYNKPLFYFIIRMVLDSNSLRKILKHFVSGSVLEGVGIPSGVFKDVGVYDNVIKLTKMASVYASD